MKNRLMTSGVLAAAVLALGVAATPAAAAFREKLSFTFYPSSGGAYCDGLTLRTTDGLAYQGFHVDSDCDGANDPAGGLVVSVRGHKVIEMITGAATQLPNLPLVFYIDPKRYHWTWALYLNTYDLNGTNAYLELDNGYLIRGAPDARRGGVSSLQAALGLKRARPKLP